MLDGVAGTSAERVPAVVVVNESEEMDEMEEDGVWVLLERGGGVENVSGPRSGSNGELDGEGEGVWTFMGNVKARGVGEIILSRGGVGSGSATATTRACRGELVGGVERRRVRLTTYESVARADIGHDGSNGIIGRHAKEVEGGQL